MLGFFYKMNSLSQRRHLCHQGTSSLKTMPIFSQSTLIVLALVPTASFSLLIHTSRCLWPRPSHLKMRHFYKRGTYAHQPTMWALTSKGRLVGQSQEPPPPKLNRTKSHHWYICSLVCMYEDKQRAYGIKSYTKSAFAENCHKTALIVVVKSTGALTRSVGESRKESSFRRRRQIPNLIKITQISIRCVL